MSLLLRGFGVSVGLVLSVQIARADVVTLIADRDNSIYNEAQNSNGAHANVWVGRTSPQSNQAIRRGLVHFDLSTIPAGSVINVVRMDILVDGASPINPGPTPVELHRLDEDWGEGASNNVIMPGAGDPAQPGDATWTDRFYPGTLWTVPGGTFQAQVSASTMIGGTGFYTFTSLQMAIDVEFWLQSPGQNFGWILIGHEGQAATSKRFFSGDAGANQVAITVTYTPQGGGPGAAFCFGDGCPCGNDSPTSGCINSTGSGATLDATGSASWSADDLVLTTTGCPPQNTGLYFLGGVAFTPVFVGDGLACTGGIFRYFPGQVSAGGVFVLTNPVASSFPVAIQPGERRHFQSWTRDVLCGPPPAPCPSPCGQNSNLSNAYSVLFTL